MASSGSVFAHSDAIQADLQHILDQAIDNKKIFGTSFALQKGGFSWEGTSGNLLPEQGYFIASTTKLFTTAIILRLVSQKKLMLGDKISRYLDSDTLHSLHVYKGRDYSAELSVQHLLAHTSGLPDYFQGKGATGESLEDTIKTGKDRAWTFGETLAWAKAMGPLFAPGTKGKAHYSDTNFQLLGQIIQNIRGESFGESCNSLIIHPLAMANSYLYTDPSDQAPKCLYYKDSPLHIPRAMTSFGPDGGMVSTSADMLKFLQAFFTGGLFPYDYIDSLQTWNRIFFPVQSGIGIHLFRMPWIFNPTGAMPEFIGHSGLSGALAYYSPKEHLFIAGTVNQVAYPDLSFKMMIKLCRKISALPVR